MENILIWALIIICAIGQIFHSGLSKGHFRKGFYCFYTNLSNAAALLFYLFFMLVPKGNTVFEFFHSDISRYCITMTILLTFAIYHFILRPQWLSGKVENGRERHYAFHNIIVHYIVPLLTVAIWILFAPKANLTLANCLLWVVIPLAYAAFVYIRARFCGNIGNTNSPYPYPFMDVSKNGVKKTAVIIIAICALGMAAGAIVYFAVNLF